VSACVPRKRGNQCHRKSERSGVPCVKNRQAASEKKKKREENRVASRVHCSPYSVVIYEKSGAKAEVQLRETSKSEVEAAESETYTQKFASAAYNPARVFPLELCDQTTPVRFLFLCCSRTRDSMKTQCVQSGAFENDVVFARAAFSGQ
jgi:hypothetical protein